MINPKILFFDIEILPQHFSTRFGADRSTLCTFGYAWHGDKSASALDLLDFPEDFHNNPFKEKKLIKASHKIMSKAQVCIGHYSDRFDLKYMNTKFLKHNLTPVTIVTAEDTWKTARSGLKLSSNRLGNIAEYFELKHTKMDIPVSTWFDVIRGDEKAMRLMTKYCQQDVMTLMDVYYRLEPICKPRSHGGVLRDNVAPTSCPVVTCGSDQFMKWGFFIKSQSGRKYQKRKCKSCGHVWAGETVV